MRTVRSRLPGACASRVGGVCVLSGGVCFPGGMYLVPGGTCPGTPPVDRQTRVKT